MHISSYYSLHFLFMSSFNNLLLYVDFRVIQAALLTIALNYSIVISFLVSISSYNCTMYLSNDSSSSLYSIVSLPIFLLLDHLCHLILMKSQSGCGQKGQTSPVFIYGHFLAQFVSQCIHKNKINCTLYHLFPMYLFFYTFLYHLTKSCYPLSSYPVLFFHCNLHLSPIIPRCTLKSPRIKINSSSYFFQHTLIIFFNFISCD